MDYMRNNNAAQTVPDEPLNFFKEDRSYRPDEIADALKVDRSTVYRLIREISDPLPAYRIKEQGQLRCFGRDINKYLENHKVQPHNE
jgi:excisionase family DNA binding protein